MDAALEAAGQCLLRVLQLLHFTYQLSLVQSRCFLVRCVLSLTNIT